MNATTGLKDWVVEKAIIEKDPGFINFSGLPREGYGGIDGGSAEISGTERGG